MYAARLFALVLATAVTLAAANPLVAPREQCGICTSPTGCPGSCADDGLCHGVCVSGSIVNVPCPNACPGTPNCQIDNNGVCQPVSIYSIIPKGIELIFQFLVDLRLKVNSEAGFC
jgi:hypothetical protein